MGAKKQNMTLEDAFEKLEGAISELEKEDISLEESFQKYQEGMKLLQFCNETIDQVEQKVLIITKEGELSEFSK